MADKKKIKVRDAVAVYSALRGITNYAAFDTADICAIVRNHKALKPIAEPYIDFERDATERLKPEDYAALAEKRDRYNGLTPEEQREVSERLSAYNRAVAECIMPEQEKETEVEIVPMSETAIAEVAKAANYMPIEVLIVIDDICGK